MCHCVTTLKRFGRPGSQKHYLDRLFPGALPKQWTVMVFIIGLKSRLPVSKATQKYQRNLVFSISI